MRCSWELLGFQGGLMEVNDVSYRIEWCFFLEFHGI
jgi:hypothetical protein